MCALELANVENSAYTREVCTSACKARASRTVINIHSSLQFIKVVLRSKSSPFSGVSGCQDKIINAVRTDAEVSVP